MLKNKKSGIKKLKNKLLFQDYSWGKLTWPNQDDRMNMTKICEHDRKIDIDKP